MKLGTRAIFGLWEVVRTYSNGYDVLNWHELNEAWGIFKEGAD